MNDAVLPNLSAYPSFILSGLLSPPSSSPSSLRSRDSFDLGTRRGSLPTDSPPYYADDASMFYFTLQPRRDKDEFRSFLSLDLAESQSLRSHSIRHKSSSHRRSRRQQQPTQRYSREPPFAVDFQIPDSPCLLPPQSPMSPRKSPTNLNSPRALPSPKPAPVSSLPSVPPTPTSPRSQTLQVTVSRTTTPIAIQPVPKRKLSLASQATRASATTSTVSTRYRRTRRSRALAALEGRRPIVPSGDFMSLSEDESDEEPLVMSLSASPTEELLDLSLSDDQLIMLIARLDDGDLRSAPSPPRSKPSSRGSSVQQPSPRRRKPNLGLKSFMDFYNDDESSRVSWRSYIEVAT
ncbi:hypothetical protein C8F04DRAFT_723204 [Mycena alexandri]|uniref:Uncharacterized protein n=1 Tax=Mycena alexandri TaxID=1745969 RepID=A0AAD6TGM3_9AGAR|nr:hypothetical protein C8F04DRAFT_723204 [Mycena alexandri]